MARNYSIVMLLMFVYAAIYTAPRRSPAWLVLVLFLLTQTHIIAMLLVPFYLFIWFGDGWRARRSRLVPHDPLAWVIVAAVVSSAGIMAAMATVYPTNNDLMVQDFPDTTRILHAIGSAILQPGYFYCGPYDLTCSSGPRRLVEATWTALLYLAVAGLAVRLPLLLSGLGGLWGTALFFQLVYTGGYRHQAMWIVFLITLYWFAFEGEARWLPAQPSKKSRFLRCSFYGAFGTILFIHLGIPIVYQDIVSEISKSRAFAELLATSTDLHGAIILAEPEWIAEAIPYYADNDIYLLRERKFGKVSTWSSRTSKLDLTLHDILVTAQDLKESSGRPILILLEYPVTVIEPQQIREFAGTAKGMWRFSYDGDEARAFLAATRKLSLGPKATLENFEAYLLQ
jgi:hypothetical protein